MTNEPQGWILSLHHSHENGALVLGRTGEGPWSVYPEAQLIEVFPRSEAWELTRIASTLERIADALERPTFGAEHSKPTFGAFD